MYIQCSRHSPGGSKEYSYLYIIGDGQHLRQAGKAMLDGHPSLLGNRWHQTGARRNNVHRFEETTVTIASTGN